MSARYFVELSCGVVASSEEQLEDHVLRLIDALEQEPGVIDPDVAAELTTGQLTIGMAIDATSDGEALETTLVRMRSAIHAAQIATPQWPGSNDVEIKEGFDARVRPANLQAAC
ncbi:hypothetical protein GCM10029964_103000 [Kibdelosporangium lantanae]